MGDLATPVKYLKNEKQPWKSVTFNKVAGFRLNPATLLKVRLLHWCYSHFLYCTNGTKSRKVSHFTSFYKPEIVGGMDVLNIFSKSSGKNLRWRPCFSKVKGSVSQRMFSVEHLLVAASDGVAHIF